MSGPTTARVPGHTLLFEGQSFDSDGTRTRYYSMQSGHGKCSCGALSGVLDSKNARKRWHREHKGEVIAAGRRAAEIHAVAIAAEHPPARSAS